METMVRFDMRGPEFGAPLPDLYQTALDMAEYADQHGADVIALTEHHGSDDGYCPAPFVLAGGVAARTRRARIRLASVVLPLHNPVEVAEQTLVLDHLSNGRVDLAVCAGYVPSEFAMFGRTLERRARLLDDGIPLLASALRGDEVTVAAHRFTITPLPLQKPGVPLYVAGGVAASARRAARWADGFFPMVSDQSLREVYRAECISLGREPGRVLNIPMTLFVHISEDPERAWKSIGEHALHDLNSYGRWAAESTVGDLRTPFTAVDDVAAARACGLYRVVAPEECLAMMKDLATQDCPLVLTPLLAGLDPDLAWESLQLFFERVLPAHRQREDLVISA